MQIKRRQLVQIRAGRGARGFREGAYNDVSDRNENVSATKRCEVYERAEIIPFESAT